MAKEKPKTINEIKVWAKRILKKKDGSQLADNDVMEVVLFVKKRLSDVQVIQGDAVLSDKESKMILSELKKRFK